MHRFFSHRNLLSQGLRFTGRFCVQRMLIHIAFKLRRGDVQGSGQRGKEDKWADK
ncbi:hypothetical protein D1872_336050 [compost metagenome]